MAGKAHLSEYAPMHGETFSTPEIAARMKKARNDAGLTQEQAAELIGVSRTAVTMWESVKRPALPETFRLHKIEQVYGCSIGYLLQGEARNDAGSTGRVEQARKTYAVTNSVEQLADNLSHMWLALSDEERRRFYDQIALAYGIAQINKRPRPT